jgi:hypothetical protein
MKVILGLLRTVWCSVVSVKNQYKFWNKKFLKPRVRPEPGFYIFSVLKYPLIGVVHSGHFTPPPPPRGEGRKTFYSENQVK